MEADTGLLTRSLALSPSNTYSLALTFCSNADHIKDHFPSLFPLNMNLISYFWFVLTIPHFVSPPDVLPKEHQSQWPKIKLNNILPTSPPHPSTTNLGARGHLSFPPLSHKTPTSNQLSISNICSLSNILLALWHHSLIHTFPASGPDSFSPNCSINLATCLFKCKVHPDPGVIKTQSSPGNSLQNPSMASYHHTVFLEERMYCNLFGRQFVSDLNLHMPS